MKCSQIIIYTLLLISVTAPYLSAQDVLFSRDESILSEQDLSSGVALGVADMNGDFRDDILATNNGRDIYVYLQNVNHPSWESFRIQQPEGAIWSMTIGDYNQDNRMDVFSSSALSVAYWSSGDSTNRFIETGFLPQAANLVDINGDGRVDLFQCNDVGVNEAYINIGNENFKDSLIADFDNGGTYDGSGNYGSVWTDVNNDGRLDLFIAKCRAGVDDPEDPRRLNNLFIATENGLVDEAGMRGVQLGAQSWSADFGDIDNDGDMDLFVTNHYEPNTLYENDGNGFFSDISDQLVQEDIGFPIQSIFRDVNNDGLLDIIVTGTRDYIYLNEGNNTFRTILRPFAPLPAESMALGDFNYDGRIDVLLGYAEVFNNPTELNNLVYLNETNPEGNYLYVSLSKEDGKTAIGARLNVYTEQGIHARDYRAGESYGISNSHTIHVTTSANQVDSVEVLWPDGQRTVYQDILLNNHYWIRPSTCPTQLIFDVVPEPLYECVPGTVASLRGEQIAWSTGEISNEIEVESGTIYGVYVENEDCQLQIIPGVWAKRGIGSNVIYVEKNNDVCDQSEFRLRAPNGSDYVWSNQSTSQSLRVNSSGLYSVTYVNPCGEFESTFIEIDINPTLEPPSSVVSDTINGEGIVTLMAEGDQIIWRDADGNEVLRNDNALRINLSATDSFFVSQYDTAFINGLTVLDNIEMRSTTTGSLWPVQFFDVINDVHINSFQLTTERAGLRSFIVENIADNEVVATIDAVLSDGASVIEADWYLPAGRYRLYTDSLTNLTSFGGRGPLLSFNNNREEHFPFGSEEGILWRGSAGSGKTIFGIHDIQYDVVEECESVSIPVYGVVEDLVNNEELSVISDVNIFPNPAEDHLIIHPSQGLSEYTVLDAKGHIVLKGDVSSDIIELGDLSSGYYILNIMINGESVHRPFLKF